MKFDKGRYLEFTVLVLKYLKILENLTNVEIGKFHCYVFWQLRWSNELNVTYLVDLAWLKKESKFIWIAGGDIENRAGRGGIWEDLELHEITKIWSTSIWVN